MLTWVNTGFAQISDGSALHHIPDGVSFDRLVFRNTSATVGAAQETDVTPSFLIAATISSLFSL